jgi:Peptidase M15
MKRLLTVALGVALCTLGTAAANARPSDFPAAHDNYSSYRNGDGDYQRPRYRRQANSRRHRRYGARTGRRIAVTRSGRRSAMRRGPAPLAQRSFMRYAAPGSSRSCLTSAARALLGRIESQFGQMQIISTCRPGARIAGTGRISRHASGNAVDFNAGGRKGEVVRWLIANHRSGGTMTYAGMSHVHVDIGPHFVSLNSGGYR